MFTDRYVPADANQFIFPPIEIHPFKFRFLEIVIQHEFITFNEKSTIVLCQNNRAFWVRVSLKDLSFPVTAHQIEAQRSGFDLERRSSGVSAR